MSRCLKDHITYNNVKNQSINTILLILQIVSKNKNIPNVIQIK